MSLEFECKIIGDLPKNRIDFPELIRHIH